MFLQGTWFFFRLYVLQSGAGATDSSSTVILVRFILCEWTCYPEQGLFDIELNCLVKAGAAIYIMLPELDADISFGNLMKQSKG